MEEKERLVPSDSKPKFWRAPFKRKIRIFDLVKESFEEFKRDEALTRGAALAYTTVLSLAPLLIIVVAVAGLAFGVESSGAAPSPPCTPEPDLLSSSCSGPTTRG